MDKYKEDVINRLFKMLESESNHIREDETTPIRDRLSQADVIIDTMHFLKDYDENVKVLNEYWLKKHKQEKQEGR